MLTIGSFLNRIHMVENGWSYGLAVMKESVKSDDSQASPSLSFSGVADVV